MRSVCRTVAVATILALAVASGATAQSMATIRLRLTTAPMDASMRNVIGGTGAGTATVRGTKLDVTGMFEGLPLPASAAHIHNGRATGVRGPAILDLTVTKAASGAFSGSFDLTETQMESLKRGRLYIQIDNEKAQDGDLWAWLLP